MNRIGGALLGSLLALMLACGANPAPAGATTLFGLIDTGELYSSSNGGATWSILATLAVHDAVGLAAGSSSSELYLATRSGSIYRSTNAGSSWTAVGAVAASDVAGFALGPFGALLVLTRSGILYSSSNQGAIFTPLAALTGSDWVCLARGPLGGLYALTETGQIAQSADQGTSWTTVGAITTSNAVSIRRVGGSALYVVNVTGEVYRSIDYGASWLPVAALSQGSVSALVDLGAQLVAATREGEVAASADGAFWTWVGTMNQLHVIGLGSDTPMVTGVPEETAPPAFMAHAPYPNPRVGAGGATFGFSLSAPDRVRLEIYDVRGRLRATRPFESIAGAGYHTTRWEPEGLPPGTYHVRLITQSGRRVQTKWTLLR